MCLSAEEMTTECGGLADDGNEAYAVCRDKDPGKYVSLVLNNPPTAFAKTIGAAGDAQSNGTSRR